MNDNQQPPCNDNRCPQREFTCTSCGIHVIQLGVITDGDMCCGCLWIAQHVPDAAQAAEVKRMMGLTDT